MPEAERAGPFVAEMVLRNCHRNHFTKLLAELLKVHVQDVIPKISDKYF